MAEQQTPNEVVATEEQPQKNPWELDWGVSEFIQPAMQAVKTITNPWEMDWGLKEATKIIPKVANAAQQVVQDLSFEGVFNKLVGAESGGKHYDKSGKLLTSNKGAKGVTQVMRKTGADPGYGVKPLQNQSREEYLRFGRDYLQAMLKEFSGDYRKAVAAYNAGPGSVINAIEKSQEKGGDWTQYLPKRSETIPYMDKILGTNEGMFG